MKAGAVSSTYVPTILTLIKLHTKFMMREQNHLIILNCGMAKPQRRFVYYTQISIRKM